MADCLYEANWQELPPELQKNFILMIQNAQRPCFYHGFGMAILNLETFTKVSLIFVTHILDYILMQTFVTVFQDNFHILYDV